MTWTPGVSGNPRGRPPKGRALTEILEKAGKTAHKRAGETRGTARNKLLADMLWQGLMTGQVVLANGRTLELGAGDWLDLAQFVYKQIDGPPKAEIDLKSDDIPVAIQFVMAAPDAAAHGNHTED